MQCLACRADNKMLLIDVIADDSTKEPVIEHKTYMCSECRHIARRLVFKRVKMPITHLPVIPIPIDKLWNAGNRLKSNCRVDPPYPARRHRSVSHSPRHRDLYKQLHA